MKFNLRKFKDVFRKSAGIDAEVPFTLGQKNSQAREVMDWLKLMCKTLESRIQSRLSPDVTITSFAPSESLEFFMIRSSGKNSRQRQEFPLMVRLSLHTSLPHDPYFSLLIKGSSPGFLSDLETRPTLVEQDIPLDRAHDIHPHIIREVFAALNVDQRENLNLALWPWSFADLVSSVDAGVQTPSP